MDVKEHGNERGIQNIVMPDGKTPYTQAGYLGIYKSFKDKMSTIISAWKDSGEVERTKTGNPKPPKADTITKWVIEAWRAVDENVMLNTIKAAGFGREEEWFIPQARCLRAGLQERMAISRIGWRRY